MKRNLKVLISAYACRPNMGSEPGVGWNMVRELVKYHKIWVITRENNRPYIEAELQQNPIPGINFIYCELPGLLKKLSKSHKIVHLHYYLWQIQAYLMTRKLHQELNFDLAHHITYVRYCTPSFISLLPIPFIWGPVGGGESAPKPFWQDFSFRGKAYEIFRNLARSLGELDPFVKYTARRSAIARATTEDTAKQLRKLGAKNVEVLSQLGLSTEENSQLAQHCLPNNDLVRFISIGRLLHWKGFHLGLSAFSQAALPENAEYWIIGDGPELQRLQNLAVELNIAHRVNFFGKLSRQETLQKLGECTALIHPSLHESGGLVCLEAMAAGRPVVCLDLGGPAIQVTEETGFKATVRTSLEAVNDIATAMTQLGTDTELRQRMSKSAQKRASEVFAWEIKAQAQANLYEAVIEKQYVS